MSYSLQDPVTNDLLIIILHVSHVIIAKHAHPLINIKLYSKAKELAVLHSRPYLWWRGQLVGFITRLNSTTEEILQKRLQRFTRHIFDVG